MEDVRRRFTQKTGAQHALRARFMEEVQNIAELSKAREILERQMAADYIASDPLNIGPDKGDAFERQISSPPPEKETHKESWKAAPVRKKRGKKDKDDIFTAFCKEHDMDDMEEYVINGVVHKRINYRKNWESDTDLFRWRKALGDISRNNKLMHEVQVHACPEFQQEFSELTQKHNALFRQRHVVDLRVERKPKKNFAQAIQLKELQKMLHPKQAKGNPQKATRRNSGLYDETDFFYNMSSKSRRFIDRAKLSHTEEQIILFLRFVHIHFKHLETAFKAVDCNGNGSVSFSEMRDFFHHLDYKGDVRPVFKSLDTNGDGAVVLKQWMKLEPYWLQDIIRRLPPDFHHTSYEKEGLLPAAYQDKFMAMVNPGPRPVLSQSAAALLTSPERPSSAELSQEESASSLSMKRLQIPPSSTGISASPDELDSPSSNSSRDRRRRSVETIDGDPGQPEEVDAVDRRGFREQNLQAKDNLPRTLSLLVYRNAHRAHNGEVVFIRKAQTIESLMKLCSQACSPVVAPVEQLFDSSLKPVRSLEQVQAGGAYLLKGQEGLDPPPQFFQHHPISDTSLRHLHEVHQASIAEMQAISGARPFSSTSQARTPTASFSRPESGVLARPETAATFDSGSIRETGLATPNDPSRPESGTMFLRPTTSAAPSRPDADTMFLRPVTSSTSLSRPESGMTFLSRQDGFNFAASTIDSLSSSRVGSPPYQPDQLKLPKARSGKAEATDKWEAAPWLTMHLSYGGLGVGTKHHNFQKWSKVRRSRTPEVRESGPLAALKL